MWVFKTIVTNAMHSRWVYETAVTSETIYCTFTWVSETAVTSSKMPVDKITMIDSSCSVAVHYML